MFVSKTPQPVAGWIGIDLDGTLVRTSDWRDMQYIGTPIPEMAERVKRWLSEGREVRIFTARVAPMFQPGTSRAERLKAQKAQWAIEDWCVQHFGEVLPVTAVKDFGMAVLYDDRCIPVETDTGCMMMDEISLHQWVTEGIAPLHSEADERIKERSLGKRFLVSICHACHLLTRSFQVIRLIGRSSF